MKFSKIEFYKTGNILTLFCSVFILLSMNISNVEAELIGTDDLKVTEHRISIVQYNDPHSITVYDEFWILNRGEEPYRNLVFNSLPEDIKLEEGMFCYISENADHICYPWKHDENNYYYWDDNYVILPKNYATNFDFEIKIRSESNSSNENSIIKTIDSKSDDVVILNEFDTWGWVRDGFNRGWSIIVNFTINNSENRSEIFEIDTLGIPPGLKIELYLDNNSNSLFDSSDILLGFDSDYDGKIRSMPDFDIDGNGIPEVNISALENKSFLIYLRADYLIHFLTKYEKRINPSKDGIFQFNKYTLYDTSLIRIFIIPHEDISVQNDEIEFEKQMSEGNLYYYGEWSGKKDSELTIRLKDETINTNDQNFKIFIIVFILFLFAMVLVVIAVNRSRKKKAVRTKKVKKEKELKKKHKTGKQNGKGKEKTSHIKTNTKKKREEQEQLVKSTKVSLGESLEKKENSGKHKQKTSKALKRLEEDYSSGKIDKDIYEELKNKYTEQERD